MLVLVLVLACAACVGLGPPSSEAELHRALAEDSRKPRLVVQVCMPAQPALDKISFAAVRRDSMASGGALKIATTARGQPYFEDGGEIAAEVLYFVVAPIGGGPGPRYAFKPPAGLSGTAWSPWSAAEFETGDSRVGYKIVNARTNYAKAPASADAPRVRYIVMSQSEYFERLRARRLGTLTEAVPAC